MTLIEFVSLVALCCVLLWLLSAWKLFTDAKRKPTNQEKVREFMEKAGQDRPAYPTLSDQKTQQLRHDLIHEELQELVEAYDAKDIVEVADAIADLLYVVYGAAVAHGIDAQACFDEVHRSNMSKFIDGHRRTDGKWIKGPSFFPPDLKKILFP